MSPMPYALQQELVSEITSHARRSFNEGIRAAAASVRVSVASSILMEAIRRDPVAGMEAIAAALEAIAHD